MKKINFFMLAVYLSFGLHAQDIEVIIANYETVIPSHWANGEGATVDNPESVAPNESEKVYQFLKPDGAWRQYLIYVESHNIARQSVKSVNFQVYNSGDTTAMSAYMLKVITQNGSENVAWEPEITLEQGWNNISYVLPASALADRLSKIEIYPNMESEVEGIFYFDNIVIKLQEDESVWVTAVSLNFTNLSMNIGQNELLIATIEPEDAENQNTIWSSDNEDVATIDVWGMVTAVGKGSATITVTTEDGEFTSACLVTVIDPTNISENTLNSSLRVFPNPYTNGILSFETGDQMNGRVEINIVSINGAMAKSYSETISEGKLILSPELSPGMYLIKIESFEKSSSQILIVK